MGKQGGIEIISNETSGRFRTIFANLGIKEQLFVFEYFESELLRINNVSMKDSLIGNKIAKEVLTLATKDD